jgi:hypothetical protein
MGFYFATKGDSSRKRLMMGGIFFSPFFIGILNMILCNTDLLGALKRGVPEGS